ncbi:MAG: hypothetical protein GY791_14380 [Alphaproteobacteria bacterium]|nr:hypothetical protein [Alphaproteobacteria bacterium]
MYEGLPTAETRRPAPTVPVPLSAAARWSLAALVLVALAVRLAAVALYPNYNHPDEIYQTLEQAVRLNFDYGVVPWEFRTGLRSWLLPAFIAVIVWLADLTGTGAAGYLWAVDTVFAVISLSVVVVAFLYGYRRLALTGAVVAGAFAALWFELVYFAPKTLSEAVAAHVLLVGVYLAETARAEESRRRLVVAGLLLGLAFCLRLHLAPAVLLTLFWVGRLQFRDRWAPLCAAMAVPVAAVGILDFITWGLPFQSFWHYVWVNVVEAKSAAYGVAPPWWYPWTMSRVWSDAALAIAALWIAGGLRAPLVALLPVVIIVTHSLFDHKEYRFIYPAIPFIAVAAGIGLAALVEALFGYGKGKFPRPALIAGAVAIVAAVSLALAASGYFGGFWTRHAGTIAAYNYVGRQADACGLGLFRVWWSHTPGYAHLANPMPVYLVRGRLRDLSPSFNYVLTPGGLPEKVGRYTRRQCWGDGGPVGENTGPTRVCVYLRPGPCDGGTAGELNATLVEIGH